MSVIISFTRLTSTVISCLAVLDRLCEHRYDVKQNFSDFVLFYLFIYLFIRTYTDWCEKIVKFM